LLEFSSIAGTATSAAWMLYVVGLIVAGLCLRTSKKSSLVGSEN
jgi:uncharacterized membrane protein YtjA (UPF0391 family)